ncbi:MAG TPA: hypothetical protein VGG90_05015 [Candidatus Dormibacteraeota bacterium]
MTAYRPGPSTAFAGDVNRLALDLAWSLWSELGVAGGRRRHDWQAVDLEPLIVFTSWLGSDNRLRASAIEWSIANARFASTFRLRHFAEGASPAMHSAFGRFAATVRAHARAPWPGQGEPLGMLRRQEVVVPDLRRPSLIQLRLRALVGVSARAEILKKMIAEPDRPQSASVLAEDAGYGKGSLAQALEMLTMTGLVLVQPSANRLHYRLARPADLAQALQWLPSTYPDWWPIFKITEALCDFARSDSGASDKAAAAEQLRRRIDGDLRRLGITHQVPIGQGPAAAAELEHWAVMFLTEQAGRAPGVGAAPLEVSYRVHHLSFGGWLGTTVRGTREPVALEVDGQAQVDERAGAARLAHVMFMDALDKPTRKQSNGGLIHAISREFAQELLQPIRAGQEATFTAEFVRRWYENRHHRFGATA